MSLFQFLLFVLGNLSLSNLHSNMSLFQFSCTETSGDTMTLFTFQYVSISIQLRIRCNKIFYHLHSNMSLFQSVTRIPTSFLTYSTIFCRPAKAYKYFTISPSLILRKRSKITYLSCLQNSVDVRVFLHYQRSTV